MKLIFKKQENLVPFHLKSFIEALGEEVLINGTYLFSDDDVLELKGLVSLKKEMVCDLCLERFEGNFEFEISENIKPAEQDGDYHHNGSEFIMDDLIYEEFILNLPDTVKCSENCFGLCYKCGANLNKSKCNCETKEINPKFQILEQLINEDK